MIERAPAGEAPDGTAPAMSESKTPLYLTIGILAVMGLALAIDASSVPGLVLLVVAVIGSLIGALIYYG